MPQTEFRAARFNVGQQIIWFKKEYGKGFAGVDMDTVDQQGGGQPDTKAFPFSKVEKGFPKTYLSRAEASQQATVTTGGGGTSFLETGVVQGPPELGDILPCGKPPELKRRTLSDRAERKEKADGDLATALEGGVEEDIRKASLPAVSCCISGLSLLGRVQVEEGTV